MHGSAAVDAWALGCIFIELLTGQNPMADRDALGVLLRIFKVFGTPSQDLLAFPSLWRQNTEESNQRGCGEVFVDLVSNLPKWQGLDLKEWINDAVAVDLAGKLL